ncbi:MAG: pyrroline-5-carboxylate reductase [Eubacteriales bacterium]|nr:pyrroline-5-carboxylate reductase [Eubacteriales bacterium]
MKIGFIGAGNMAGAIIGGMVKGTTAPENIYCADVLAEKTQALAQQHGIRVCETNAALVACCDVVVIAVKPQMVPAVLPKIRAAFSENKLLISIAAGVSIARIAELLGGAKIPIVRVMPNINAFVGEAATALCHNEYATVEQIAFATALFSSIGIVMEVEEGKIALFSGIGGCSPAYAYMFIDALARAGVKHGFPKDMATRIAAQAVLGSAKMVLSGQATPWELVDKVCSPAGTTIAGVYTLEQRAFVGAIMEAVDASMERDLALSQK